MSDIEQMQKLLDTVLVRITDLEDSIKNWKTRNSQSNPGAMMELRDLKKKLAAQQRVKITLIQSIQELNPSSENTTMTVFRPIKSSFVKRFQNLFRRHTSSHE